MVHLAPDFKIQPFKIIQACSILWHSLAFAWFTGKLCLQNCKYRSLTPQPSLSALSSKLPMDSLLSSDFSRWHKLHGTETKLSGFLKALLFGWRWGKDGISKHYSLSTLVEGEGKMHSTPENCLLGISILQSCLINSAISFPGDTWGLRIAK